MTLCVKKALHVTQPLEFHISILPDTEYNVGFGTFKSNIFSTEVPVDKIKFYKSFYKRAKEMTMQLHNDRH